MSNRVVVVGAGAAGSMAAIFAARSGAQVTLVERTRDGGRKILISGGGRCNVLPAELDETRFVTDSSPNTLRKMLRSWPLDEQVEFFQGDLGIPLVVEEETKKRFPASNKARDVRDGLLEYARQAGVNILFETLVTDVAPLANGWRLLREAGPPLDADVVVVATGGLSVPNTGSDGTGLAILQRLGHAMHPTYPALTPITGDVPAFTALAGISLTVTLTARDANRSATATGGFLFTHRGYSGPSVLDVSHVITRASSLPDERATISVRWAPLDDKRWENALRAPGLRTVIGVLRAEMPDRLALALTSLADVDPQRTLAELRREERLRLIDVLVRCDLPWTGDEGYKKAEVTGGGVSLAEVDPRSMQSRRHPGLYICGEALDAFGPIGGYNFAWSWATGRAAGHAAAEHRATP
ncbi:MAG TPA: aminoacetone oxidase family FAD-binding enzyme [Gemmatimonadaceae bacterium]|nr:aminoacetone oxidase family FAD-binding enzyme [Gemmatimonadaceae bacterium]